MRQRLWYGVSDSPKVEDQKHLDIFKTKTMNKPEQEEQGNNASSYVNSSIDKDVIIWSYPRRAMWGLQGQQGQTEGTQVQGKQRESRHRTERNKARTVTNDAERVSVSLKRKQRLKKQKALKTETDIQIIKESMEYLKGNRLRCESLPRAEPSSKPSLTRQKQHVKETNTGRKVEEEKSKHRASKKYAKEKHKNTPSSSKSPSRRKSLACCLTETDDDESDDDKSDKQKAIHRKSRKRKVAAQKNTKVSASVLTQTKKSSAKKNKKKSR